MNNCPLILICDDDPVVHESLSLYLDHEGFAHISAYSGDQALRMLEERTPDLILLDLMMPGKSGLDVCRAIRANDSPLPIIMLTAKSEEIDRIVGLELGADDYVTKPFSPREVLARIKAVLRRFVEDDPEKEGLVRFPNLEINLTNYQVLVKGKNIACTPKEVEILHLLASHAGQVFSREQLLSHVWGYDFFGDTRTVDTHIKRIRHKLPQEGMGWTLKTVYGVGYKFEVEP